MITETKLNDIMEWFETEYTNYTSSELSKERKKLTLHILLKKLYGIVDCEFKDEYNWGTLKSTNKNQIPIR